MAQNRQILLDSIGLRWSVLDTWMVMSPRTALWHDIGVGAFTAVAVLFNEISFLIAVGLLPVSSTQPIGQEQCMLSRQADTHWTVTLEWAQGYIPEGNTVLVPEHM